MAEAVGLAASLVTLAALFSTCIECFSYFKAAQNCPIEAESLLVKLDCEKARLLVWGNTVGILQTDPVCRYAQLTDLTQVDLIRRCIHQIISLLTDAQKLESIYGGRTVCYGERQRDLAVVSMASTNAFRSAKRGFFTWTGAGQRMSASTSAPTSAPSTSLLTRVKWAIRDADKFQNLVLNLRDFVDSLTRLVPVPPEVIVSRIEEDIVSLPDLDSLRLIVNACDDENYPQWSARASELIEESDAGTSDRRNLEDIWQDPRSIEIQNVSLGSQMAVSALSDALCHLNQTSVVLTDRCLNFGLSNSTDCGEQKIGSTIISGGYSMSFTSHRAGRWNLDRRIMNNISPSSMGNDRLRQDNKLRLTGTTSVCEPTKPDPCCKLLVYCGACACAVSTARVLVDGDSVPEYLDVAIRIDDRIPTTCSRSDSQIDVLTAVRDEVDEADTMPGIQHRSLNAIDCPFLEKRIHALEQENFEDVSENILQTILTEVHEEAAKSDLVKASQIVIIVEADLCDTSLEGRSFLHLARKPRPCEIYTFHYDMDTCLWRRDFVGRFTRSKAAKRRETTRDSMMPAPLTEDTASFRSPDLINIRKRSRRGSSSD